MATGADNLHWEPKQMLLSPSAETSVTSNNLSMRTTHNGDTTSLLSQRYRYKHVHI